MRVGTDDDLSRQREIFDNGVVTDRFRSAFGTLTVQPDLLLRRETLLRRRESFGSFQQSHLAMFRRHYAAEKRKVVAKRKHRLRLRHAGVLPQRRFQKRPGNRSPVLLG